MTAHPEDTVVADIDALIDAQIAAGPVDDYDADYYPKCPDCQCDWHGIQCVCGCNNGGKTAIPNTSIGSPSYYTPPERARRDINFHIRISELEAMREQYWQSRPMWDSRRGTSDLAEARNELWRRTVPWDEVIPARAGDSSAGQPGA